MKKNKPKDNQVRKYTTLGPVYQRMKVPSVKGKKPLFDTELSIDQTAIFKRMKLVPYMPDKLLTKKKIDILNQMMEDDEIDAAIDELKLLRLSKGYEVEAASDSPADKEIRDEVEWNLEHVEGSFYDDLREIMGGLEMGISINEIIWRVNPDGKYKNHIGIANIKSKNPQYFNLYTDDFDNLRPNGVVNISSLGYGSEYPVEKFIIYSFNKKYENIWGTSRIRALYDWFYIKRVAMRSWGIYIEKFGHPFPVFTHPAGIDEGTKKYLEMVIEQIRSETGFRLPKGVELKMIEAAGRGADVHERLIEFVNKQIRKKIMGQTLTSDQGQKGTQALGNVHYDILQSYLDHLGQDVAEKAVNKQLITRLVDYNHPNVESYPIFKFKPIIEDDIPKNIEIYYGGIDRQAIKPIPEDEEKIREYIKFPPRNVEANPAAVVADPTIPGQTKPTAAANVGQNVEIFTVADVRRYADKIFTGVNRRKFTTYEEVVDFAEIKSRNETVTEKYAVRAGAFIKAGINDMVKNIQRIQILEKKDFRAVNTVQFPADATGAIKNVFAEMLKETFQDGMAQGRREVTQKKRRARKHGEVLRFQYDLDLRKITPTEALDYFDAKAFDMAGIERGNITDKVKIILYNALKTGASIRDTMTQIESDLEEYYIIGEVSDAAMQGYRIETVIRTNLNEAVNEGRKAMFEAPELEGYVTAYQYSAVLDDRVRQNHLAGDGLIFPVMSPVWDHHTPPMGFNCRCLLVPVTEDEQYEISRLPAAFHPDAGFGKPGL